MFQRFEFRLYRPCPYDHVVAFTIYVACAARSRGVDNALQTTLIERAIGFRNMVPAAFPIIERSMKLYSR
jgi:L-amino acid N-acyltransferase YncA